VLGVLIRSIWPTRPLGAGNPRRAERSSRSGGFLGEYRSHGDWFTGPRLGACRRLGVGCMGVWAWGVEQRSALAGHSDAGWI